MNWLKYKRASRFVCPVSIVRKRRIFFLASLCLGFLLMSSCKTPQKESELDLLHSIPGDYGVTQLRSTALVLVGNLDMGGGALRACSATAISNFHLLVSAKCLLSQYSLDQIRLRNLAVSFYVNFQAASKHEMQFWSAENVAMHPNFKNEAAGNWEREGTWNKGGVTANYDLAVVELRKPIPYPLFPAIIHGKASFADFSYPHHALYIGHSHSNLVNAYHRQLNLGNLAYATDRLRLKDEFQGYPRKGLLKLITGNSAGFLAEDPGGALFSYQPNFSNTASLVGIHTATKHGFPNEYVYTRVHSYIDWLRCSTGLALDDLSMQEITEDQKKLCKRKNFEVNSFNRAKLSLEREEIPEGTSGPLSDQEFLGLRYFRNEMVSNCDKDELKKAYRSIARKSHPDLTNDVGAEEKMKELNKEWEIVKKHCKF